MNKLKANAIFFWKIITHTPLKYILLFIFILSIVLIYGKGTWWGELVNRGLPFIFSFAIFSLIAQDLWNNRSKLDFVVKIYFQSGILSYLRAFGIVVITLTLGVFIYLHVPDILRWGWGNLIFGNSGNVALQPLNTASEMGQKVSEIQGNNFDYRWFFLTPVWIIFILALPFLAEVEEKIFRQGVHYWKGIIINSIKFGLIHLTMGIPICWAFTLVVPGFLFACRYKYVYHQHLKTFKDETKARQAGVIASTADHAIYNAILITLSVAIVLIAQ